MPDKRIDTRPRNRWDVQAGLRNVHRDMRGNVLGGVTADGRAIGNKRGRQVGTDTGDSPDEKLGGGLERLEKANVGASGQYRPKHALDAVRERARKIHSGENQNYPTRSDAGKEVAAEAKSGRRGKGGRPRWERHGVKLQGMVT